MPMVAHELGSHAVLLITKYMLDAGVNSKSHRGSWVHGQFGNVTEPSGSLRDRQEENRLFSPGIDNVARNE
jgi:hypothetical protein